MFVKPRHDRGECTLKKMTFRCFTYWPNKHCNRLELLMEIEHFLLKCWHNVLLFSMIFFFAHVTSGWVLLWSTLKVLQCFTE